MRDIVVTGGCGFIGSFVVDNLVKRGYKPHVIDIKSDFLNKGAIYYTVDILDSDEINRVFKLVSPSVCIHLAGILGTSETWNYPNETVNVNINGANNVYDACGKNKCNIITVDVGSRWLSPYTISKTCSAEFALGYANRYNIKCGLLRIFNVYGPRQSTKIIKICPMFIYKSMKDEELEVWGNKNLDLVYVDDVANAFVNAVENLNIIDRRRDLYIGCGVQMTTGKFAEIVINKIGSGHIGFRKERLGEENTESGYMNNTTSKDLLKWTPVTSLEDGLNNTIEYYKNQNILETYETF